MSGRDTPPDIQDGPYGFQPDSVSYFDEGGGAEPETLSPETGKKVALEAYLASTNWLNSGRRAAWNDSLRTFQNKHPTGSKYLTRDYRDRSNLFRPKTRSMVRNDEAQTASAFFSNEDVVSIQPTNEDDPTQKASADLMQEILQYRLTKTIPWFLTLVGARQDTEVMGICAAKLGWRYEEEYSHTERHPRFGDDGMPVMGADGAQVFDEEDVMRKTKDEPFIDLLAPENIRFEPGADWRDPIKASPYVIELMPMYIQDIEERMESGEWKRVAESSLRSATDRDDDVTRRSREQGRVPGKDHDAWKPRAFDIGWVRRNIIRWYGKDWHYYTLGSAGEMLTDPVPLEQVELHGERPYVVGCVVLETHKSYPSSKVEITADLQRAANDDWNLRFDNVKMTLNPRQFVKAGYGLEQQDLTRFAPGKVVTVSGKQGEGVESIVSWDRPPPPDASAYAEQDRINLDWDELTGAFTNSSIQASQIQQQSATGMHLMSGIASGMNEYELRVFSETFVEPALRLMVKLIQKYETDPVILALAGSKAQLFQKYGLNHITDELLNQELTTRVNVGIGATNPSMKMRNLLSVAQALGSIFGPVAAQGANFEEVAKELFGLAGYKDGKRFLVPDFDPRVAQLQQQLQKLQGKGAQGQPPDMSKVQAAQITTQGKLQEQQMKDDNDRRSDAMEFQRDRMAEQSENWRQWMQAKHEEDMAGQERLHAAHMAYADRMHQSANDQIGRQHDMTMAHQDRSHQAQQAQHGQQARQGPAKSQQNDGLPPEVMSKLAEGHVTSFGNGQRWTKRGGRAARVT